MPYYVLPRGETSNGTIVIEQVHQSGGPFSAFSALDREHLGAGEANPQPGGKRDLRVEYITREPARRAMLFAHEVQPNAGTPQSIFRPQHATPLHVLNEE